MSLTNVWEVTPDDIQRVLNEHGIACDLDGAEVVQALGVVRDHSDKVSLAVLDLDDFDEQSSVALETVEGILIRRGVVSGPALLTTSRARLTS